MTQVKLTMFDEPIRFTIFWTDGTSEVISAKKNETFSEAFQRHGYGLMSVFGVAGYVNGEKMNNFRFDRNSRIWRNRENDDVVVFVNSLEVCIPPLVIA
jgi:hypothetical protein